MMTSEIYARLRKWENLTRAEKECREEIAAYDKGATEVINRNPFTLEPETVESRRAAIAVQIEHIHARKPEIEEELAAQGIDAEAVVTGACPDLKRRAWLRNYCIVENKVEGTARHEYSIYEGTDEVKAYRKTFETLTAAVEEILSYYRYLGEKRETAQAIADLRWK